MRHTSCLLSPARALHRVLLLELANTNTNTNKSHVASSTLAALSLSSPTTFPTLRYRHAAPCHIRALYTKSPASSQSKMEMRKKHLRDKDIPYRWVRIADESGVLSPPQRTETVLASLPPRHSLVMKAPPPPPSPTDKVVQPAAAICRIVDMAAELAEMKQIAQALKESKQIAKQTKTLEVNWAIAAHDLGHKMRRLEEFLNKGMRVEILLAKKKRSRISTKEEQEGLVEHIQEVAAKVPGSNEYKKPDGVLGGVLKLFFEGPAGKKKAKKDKGDEEE